MFGDVFTAKGFKQAVPILALFFGFTMLVIGIATPVHNYPLLKEFFTKVGQTILAGGVFAVILKSMQFMGVFKDELMNIIYSQKYLEGRTDILEIWEKISKIVFKNKFIGISKEITDDVRRIYFPTEHVLYYSKYKQTVEIELVDAATQTVKVTSTSEYTVLPKDKDHTFPHEAKNTLKFTKSADEISFKILNYKVNGKDKKPIMQEKIEDGNKLVSYTVELTGEESYKFETVIEKVYSLNNDNVIGTMKNYIIKDFDLTILTKGGINIDFHSCGTLKPFNCAGVKTAAYRKYEYRGIIYPKQGFLMVLKMN